MRRGLRGERPATTPSVDVIPSNEPKIASLASVRSAGGLVAVTALPQEGSEAEVTLGLQRRARFARIRERVGVAGTSLGSPLVTDSAAREP